MSGKLAEGAGMGLRVLLVGGDREGEIVDVANFRDGEQPDGYRPVGTLMCGRPDGRFRLDVAFAREGFDHTERFDGDARGMDDVAIIMALAKHAGLDDVFLPRRPRPC